MIEPVRLSITLIAAAGLLLALATTSSANRLSTSGKGIRAAWNSVDFIPPTGETVKCPATLEGTLHSQTITKTVGALIGFITRGTLLNGASCTGIHATIHQESLPWHVRYRDFTGILPNIASIETVVIGAAFRLEGPFGFECEYKSEANEPTIGSYALNTSHVVTSASVSGEINSVSGCGLFGERIKIRVAGTSSTVTALTIRLI